MKTIDTITNRDGEEFVFARCGEESVKALALLERKCFPLDFWSEISFLEALSIPAAKIYAAYDLSLKKIAAYGVIYTAADEGDLANIAVDPDFRNRGLGKALLTALCREAEGFGAKRLFLEVRESNEAARALYASLGFCQTGRRKNYYVNPREDAIIMQKTLNSPN